METSLPDVVGDERIPVHPMKKTSLLSPAPLSRRVMLQRSAAGFGSLALAALLGQKSDAADGPDNPLAAKAPHFPARAKRVIFLFMKGGPSHVDTFDPKPSL